MYFSRFDENCVSFSGCLGAGECVHAVGHQRGALRGHHAAAASAPGAPTRALGGFCSVGWSRRLRDANSHPLWVSAAKKIGTHRSLCILCATGVECWLSFCFVDCVCVWGNYIFICSHSKSRGVKIYQRDPSLLRWLIRSIVNVEFSFHEILKFNLMFHSIFFNKLLIISNLMCTTSGQ